MNLDAYGRRFVSRPNDVSLFNSRDEQIGTVQMPHSSARLDWGQADVSLPLPAASIDPWIETALFKR
jgi:hypothetical protein